MRETLGVLEMFCIFIWVLVETKKTLRWTSLHSRDLTFMRNTTEAFKNSKFTNMEMNLWARPLLNHISVVSPVFLCTPWHKLTALIVFPVKETKLLSLMLFLYGLPENKEASWESGPWWVAVLAYSVYCVRTHTHTHTQAHSALVKSVF